MKTEDRRVCPSCGNEFSGAVEFCPVCMLHGALADDVESGESSSERVIKPKSQDVARRFQHYEVVVGEDGRLVELGRGAMGVTYKAFDIDLRCPVTLKVISEKYLGDESARLRFLREARAAASVRHPNVASVFHLGGAAGTTSTRWSLWRGKRSQNLVRRSGRLEVKLALEIATQVAAGLAAVHKKELVHRDIKPSNIMVSFEEEGAVSAKIIDLGLAKVVDEAGAQTDDLGERGLCRNTGVRQSGTSFRRRGGYPFGSLLAWGFTLADADRSGAISGFCRRSYVSTSARSLAA